MKINWGNLWCSMDFCERWLNYDWEWVEISKNFERVTVSCKSKNNSDLIMQNDGNLVLFQLDNKKVVWSSETNQGKNKKMFKKTFIIK